MATTANPRPYLPEHLHGRWLLIAKGFWLLLATVALIVLIVGISNIFSFYFNICEPVEKLECNLLASPRLSFLTSKGLAVYITTAITVVVLVWMILGWLVFIRNARSIASLLMSLGLAIGWETDITGENFIFAFFRLVSQRPELIPLGLICSYVMIVMTQIAVVVMALTIPDGSLKPRWAIWAVLLWSFHVCLNTFYHYPFEWFQDILLFKLLDEVFAVVTPLAIICALWFKYRTFATGEMKLQLKALLPSTLSFAIVYAFWSAWTILIWSGDNPDMTTLRLASHIVQVGVQPMFGVWFGVSIGLTILRYNLFATDLFVSRTLVYGGLSGALLLLYFVIVFGLGNFLGLSHTPWFSLLASSLVIALFQPLRKWLTERVNRNLYGIRELPFREFVGVSRQLQDLIPADYFPSIVRTINQRFGLPFVRIIVASGTLKGETSIGKYRGETVRFPITNQDQPLGWLEVAVKPSELLAVEERRVLETIAGQLGVSVRSLELTAELQRLQQRLVITREEERRRLQRDLHDGLGPTLAAQTLVVNSARQLIASDPAKADALLAKLEDTLCTTLEGVRRLVYSLMPSDLDQLGLQGALRLKTEALAGSALQLELSFLGTSHAYPAAVESAAYYVVTEAVTNVVRHASARMCRIEVRETEGRLELSVTDDGTGLISRHRGLGLQNMCERAEELGGRFAVTSRLPEASGVQVSASLPLSDVLRPEVR